jgi:hypothetical protein
VVVGKKGQRNDGAVSIDASRQMSTSTQSRGPLDDTATRAGETTGNRGRAAGSGAAGSASGSQSSDGSPGGGWVAERESSQHARISSPWSGARVRSSPQNPTPAATEPRKFWHVAQLVDDLWQTQQRAVSACGVPQCGQRHNDMGGW